MTRYLKCVLAAIIAIEFIHTGVAYSAARKNSNVNKPVAQKTPISPVALNVKYDNLSFDQSIEKADAIAMVEITKKTKEVYQPSVATFYEAKVLKIYKGQKIIGTSSKINIIQDGSSSVIVNDEPLFKNNERMLLFLSKAPSPDHTFTILSGSANIYKEVKGSVNTYLIKQGQLDLMLSGTDVMNEMDPDDFKDIDLIVSLSENAINHNKQINVLKEKAFVSLLTDIMKDKENPFITKYNVMSADKGLIDSSDKFGFTIFKTEAHHDQNKNVILSPLSLFTALNVVINGASGNTREQMKKLLGIDGYSQEKLNTLMNDLINYANNAASRGDPGFTKIYNSVWIDKGFDIKNSFINESKKYYNADVFKQQLSAQNTVNAMNEWINEKSRGLIQNPISEIGENTKLDLLNILYFAGKWVNPFDKSKTAKDIFTTSTGTPLKVDMMNAKREIGYYEDAAAKACEFSYYNGNMLVLMPNGDINSFLSNLTVDDIKKYYQNLKEYIVKIKMPKLNISSKNDLVDTLRNIGITLPFDASNAEFDNLKTNKTKLFINQMIQDCTVKVDEEGTEAAALTSIMLSGAGIPPKEIKEFYINKPFVFVIQDNNNLILFAGKVENPSN